MSFGFRNATFVQLPRKCYDDSTSWLLDFGCIEGLALRRLCAKLFLGDRLNYLHQRIPVGFLQNSSTTPFYFSEVDMGNP